MESTFRKSMAWLHTWSGIVIGGLLFAIFWTGTLSVFDREIDRWMAPVTRLEMPSDPVSLDTSFRPMAEQMAAGSAQWTFSMPTDRVPMLRLSWRDAADKNVSRYFNASTGAELPATGTYAGTGFIYPFHYRLNIRFMDIGYWIVGFATMAMLVAIVSGVVIHKKICTDFFTFRPRKQIQRASLDLHNLTSVLPLPFHFLIGLSGLFILFAIYFPSGWQVAYDGDRRAFNAQASDTFQRSKSGQAGSLGSLDGMMAQARLEWGGGQVSQVRVQHQGDANGYVEVRRSIADRVTQNSQTIYFDAATGKVLARSEIKPVKTALSFLTGLHEIQFRHWTLRWLYFLAGLSGCVMIATGFVFWIESRRARHAKKGLAGVRWVEALAVFSVPGVIAATFVFFVINRLLPEGANLANYGRADLEVWGFCLAWLIALGHAGMRGQAAWREQTWCVAGLGLLAVVLNGVTTGQHLLLSFAQGVWAVGFMDVLLLVASAIAALTAMHLSRKARQVSVARSANGATRTPAAAPKAVNIPLHTALDAGERPL
ncbi:MAG: PepSY-associated TM helix domain-containing protein [Acidovorax sp.]|uniref:PepSY-associated TM helix domain-containing protein n=1 Tax=Acidovorax sp. TaxID=1872122 RepID=UPI00391D0B83